MSELRFLRADGDFIILENADGETFRVAADESLRRALKPESAVSAKTDSISPREIQDEIRAGAGIAELAERTGASLEYIEKFALPVIDELAHIVQMALSVRITVAGDRYSDTIQVEFGDLISQRLAASGISGVTWSSSKKEHQDWLVICDLGDSKATWSFDLKKLNLSPEDELAVQLSASQSFNDSPIPKLKPMPVASSTPSVPAAFAKNQEPESAAQTADLGDTMEFEGVIPFGRTRPADPVEPTMGENLANTADLLDALRKKRLEREALERANEAAAETQATVPIELAPEEPLSEAEVSQVEPEPTPTKPVKKGRAAVPSWNDIVFGTKSED